MANTYVKNIVHIVFHTKPNTTTILVEDLDAVHGYLAGTAKGIGATPVIVGGRHDHVHLLVSLPKTIALADLVRTLKTESSRWLKTLKPYYKMFAWQSGYGAFSVSASVIPHVVNYIRHQEEHHRVKSFMEEYKAFLDAHGISYDERFL